MSVLANESYQPQPEYSRDFSPATEELGTLATKQAAEQARPDVLAMSMDEYRVYVHWTARSGDARGTGFADLSLVLDNIYSRQREIMNEMADDTTQVTLLQAELASTVDKNQVIKQISEISQRLYELYDELGPIEHRTKWLRGYLDDRRPKPPQQV